MRVLIVGGTRFVGLHLCWQLVEEGHQVVLFNRGKRVARLPEGVEQIHGNRDDVEDMLGKLKGEQFDAVFDTSGRELAQTRPLVEHFRGHIRHFVYISSAGVYQKGETWPLTEASPLDSKSRHLGKAETDQYLIEQWTEQGFPATCLRPVYIYGPDNYNDIEQWFFDRLLAGRPLPVPGDGQTITQLGHARDLARACTAVLGKSNAPGLVLNISGAELVTFDGLARACAALIDIEPRIIHVSLDRLSPEQRKFFPLRTQHYFVSLERIRDELHWQPKFSLLDGLQNSLDAYRAQGRPHPHIDFGPDEAILAAGGSPFI